MTLPTSGGLNFQQINIELGKPATSPISLNDANVRALAGKPSGPISFGDLLGKSSYTPMSATLYDVDMDGQANASSPYTMTYPISIAVYNGLAPFSFTWSHVSGSGSVDVVNSASSTIRMPVPRYGTSGDIRTQVVQCTVTDAKGNALTRQCTVIMTLY